MTAFPGTEVGRTATLSGRRPYRWTLDKYHAAINAGILTENDPVELIFGELVETIPVGKSHIN